MLTGRISLRVLSCVAVIGAALAVAPPARAAGATITVNTTANLLGDGKCSFQEAMAAATNNSAQDSGACPSGFNLGYSDPDIVDFDLDPGTDPGFSGGVFTITLGSSLNITDAVIIDGTSQFGYNGIPIVRIDGGDSATTGLVFNPGSPGSTIQGLMITRFTSYQVVIQAGTSTDHVTLKSNYIGTDGSTALGGSNGVAVLGGDYAVIGGTAVADRNVISGSTVNLYVTGTGSTADSNEVRGNYIGINAAGTARIGSPSINVVVQDSGSGVTNTNIAFNVISGASNDNIYLGSATVDSNLIQGNFIGTDASGTQVIFTSVNGVHVQAGDNNIIGGNGDIGKRNLIAGILNNDVLVEGGTGTVVADNVLGMDLTGTSQLDGSTTGIYIGNADAQVARNWIGAGSTGVFLNGTATLDAGSSHNCLLDNAPEGLTNNTGVPVTFEDNWWGEASGPANATSNPLGQGTQVSDDVDFDPWSGTPEPICSPGVNHGLLSLDFSNQLVGTAGKQALTITNNGTKPLHFASLGAASAPFSVSAGASTCSTSTPVNPGASCVLAVRFKPTAATGYAGSLSFVTDVFPTPADLPLTGTGVAGTQVLLNPSFDSDGNHDGLPDKWSPLGLNLATDRRDCTVHKAGACSLVLVGNATQKTVTQVFKHSGVAGDDFTFSLWSKAATVPVGSVYRLQVKFYKGTKLQATKTMNFAAGSHGFTRASGSFTAKNAYTKVVYRIIFQATSGSAWFDAGSLRWAP